MTEVLVSKARLLLVLVLLVLVLILLVLVQTVSVASVVSFERVELLSSGTWIAVAVVPVVVHVEH